MFMSGSVDVVELKGEPMKGRKKHGESCYSGWCIVIELLFYFGAEVLA